MKKTDNNYYSVSCFSYFKSIHPQHVKFNKILSICYLLNILLFTYLRDRSFITAVIIDYIYLILIYLCSLFTFIKSVIRFIYYLFIILMFTVARHEWIKN